MFTDFYLKAADEAAMDAALMAGGFLVEGEEELTPAQDVLLDRIGEIGRVIGYDAEDEPIVLTLDGYHANLRLTFAPTEEQLAAVADTIIVPPNAPYRIWAGE